MIEQEKQELKQEILSQIKNESQSVNDLREVQTLAGVNSLPAMRGEELVSAPVSLLAQPATDAAAQAQTAKQAAETAAKKATHAAANADTKAQAAQAAAAAAQKAVDDLWTVKNLVEQIIDRYEEVTMRAFNGATARFDGVLPDVQVSLTSVPKVSGVYYVFRKKIFVGKIGNIYVNNWGSADFYMNEDRTAIRKDKIYLLGSVPYVWNEEGGTLEKVGV